MLNEERRIGSRYKSSGAGCVSEKEKKKQFFIF